MALPEVVVYWDANWGGDSFRTNLDINYVETSGTIRSLPSSSSPEPGSSSKTLTSEAPPVIYWDPATTVLSRTQMSILLTTVSRLSRLLASIQSREAVASLLLVTKLTEMQSCPKNRDFGNLPGPPHE